MSYIKVSDLTGDQIRDVCKQVRCLRQAVSKLKVHLLCIGELFDRIKEENIDVSHFNKGTPTCPKCSKDLKIMMILDFDDVGRKLGACDECKHTEWVEDGGDIIDALHYFTEGYKTHEMRVIGHREI